MRPLPAHFFLSFNIRNTRSLFSDCCLSVAVYSPRSINPCLSLSLSLSLFPFLESRFFTEQVWGPISLTEANFGCYSKFCHAFLSIPWQQELNEDFFNDLQLLFSGLRLISPPSPPKFFLPWLNLWAGFRVVGAPGRVGAHPRSSNGRLLMS